MALATGPLTAGAEERFRTGRLLAPISEAETFPSYGALCGYPIVSVITRTRAEAALDADGMPVVALDPSLWAPEEEAHRTFLIAHECAHHRLGHLAPGALAARRSNARVVTDHELSADCWAAEMLARDGLWEVVDAMIIRFYRAGMAAPGRGYPPGVTRAQILYTCGQSGVEARRIALDAAP